MWGSEKKNQRPNLPVDTLIGASTTIRGDVLFAGGLHIDGKVYGSVIAESGQGAVLVLSDKALIEGELRAPHVVVNGQVRGNIYAAERVELAAQAKVTGNIHYRILEMTAGAEVNGQIVREEEPLKRLPPPDPAVAHAAIADSAADDGDAETAQGAPSGLALEQTAGAERDTQPRSGKGRRG